MVVLLLRLNYLMSPPPEEPAAFGGMQPVAAVVSSVQVAVSPVLVLMKRMLHPNPAPRQCCRWAESLVHPCMSRK